MRSDAQRSTKELIEFLREKDTNIIHLSLDASYWTLCEDRELSENMAVDDVETSTNTAFTTCLWCLRCV